MKDLPVLHGSEEPSRDELLELAMLEMLGTLDEIESARFERAFAAATPSLQAEVRAAQERMALDPTLRSMENPPASLRLRVLARVAQAAEDDARAAAPIASIGRMSGRVATNDASASQADDIARELIARLERANPPIPVLWRAAALFLLAALVVTLYFNRETTAVSRTLAFALEGRMVEGDVRALAPGLAGYDFAGSVHHRMKATEVASTERLSGEVQVFVDPVHGRALVMVFGLEGVDGPVTLRGFGDDRPTGDGAALGSGDEKAEFESRFLVAGPAHGQLVEFAPGLLPTRFELVDRSGRVLFASA